MNRSRSHPGALFLSFRGLEPGYKVGQAVVAAVLRGLVRDGLVISPRAFGIYAPIRHGPAYGSGSVPINDQIISPASLHECRCPELMLADRMRRAAIGVSSRTPLR